MSDHARSGKYDFQHPATSNTSPRRRHDPNQASTSSSSPQDEMDEVESDSCLLQIQSTIHACFRDYNNWIKWAMIGIIAALYGAYFSYAIYYSRDNMSHNLALIIITVVALVLLILAVLYRACAPRLRPAWRNRRESCLCKAWDKCGKWVFLALCVVGLILFIALEVRKTPMRLVSGLGIFLYVALAGLVSKCPSKIPWGVVGSGILLQFLLGLLIIRWSVGFTVTKFLSEQLTRFLQYTEAGSVFVFGPSFMEHEFVFGVLMAVVFFGSVTSILYYFGIIQQLIKWFGGLMEFVMGIGPAEAFVAAANVFLGPNTSALTIKNFIVDMTLSELHNVMTSGFATVSGSLFGLYLSFNINMTHLIAASVISAPGALAVGKVMYPELSKSSLKHAKNIKFTPSADHNLLEAAMNGATEGAKIVGHICANLIAFVSLLAFFNNTIAWFGHRVGINDPELSFQYICQYVFYPLPLMMGVELADCQQVAYLIGTKLVLTDVVGYAELGRLITNRQTGIGDYISPRSEVIATYALCGFGNFGDVGICLGAIGAIAPSRKSDLCRVAVRAMVAGNIACFITACIAGFLYDIQVGPLEAAANTTAAYGLTTTDALL